ncbi:MAG: acetate--CoA ligase [Schleiferiaceae bacterium]|jgi:acetyl-CoA synthetase|nr:acetate--CoA ligase [Schleiferiaceae bacterium]
MDQIQLRTFSDYEKAYAASINEPVKFWEEIAAAFSWQEPWHKTLEWEFATPAVKWFQGGRLNITENCLDRHLKTQGEDIALLWEPNDPKEREVRLTYRELHSEVCRFANVLKAKGVKKGDRVAVYMPMIPELTIGVLACARIGAVHSVVFAGFSSNALADRINDSRCVCILTSDGMYRGEKALPVKATVDEALKNCASVESVIVIRRDGRNVTMVEGRDHWYHEAVVEVGTDCPAEPMDAEDMLFILYTSGSTGKPKGVVHTCGGYMVYAGYSFKNVFQYERGDVYWCTADVGWITGHSYIIYGPLLNGATTLMFEGVPTFPDAGRFWDVCDKYSVNQFYTAPTAIRALMACGDEYVDRAELGALKVIGSVGEPINAEAWHWYHDKVGRGNCPIVDTWWQTETGGIMISGLGNLSLQRPTYAGRPLPGIQPVLLDADGNEIEGDGVEGYLCIKHPWPSMLRTTYGDHERCKNVYFSNYKGYYFTGDGARREEGMYRIIGRVDDVINVSGHRFGTAEIENAINASRAVTESAVVGYPHDIKGQGIYAYVIVDKDTTDEETIRKSVISSLVAEIGPIAKPDVIQIVPGLPKTRSGKIMRRILRKIAEGDTSNLGDTSTLLDPSVVEVLKADAIALRK